MALETNLSNISSRTLAQPPAGNTFLTARGGVWLSFLWGFAEGTLFFVVPDVLLSLVAVVSPRRVWRHILAAVFGAVLAGALMYSWAASDPAHSYSAVAKVPFVREKMFRDAESAYERRGIGAVFLGPLAGVPYKIYAIEAPKRFGFWQFVAATAPARAWRFILVCVFSGLAAWTLRQKWSINARQFAFVHGAAWILFYAFYWGRIIST